jgi:hypothetical protein
MKNLTLKSTQVGVSGNLGYAIGEFTQQVPLKNGDLAQVTGRSGSALASKHMASASVPYVDGGSTKGSIATATEGFAFSRQPPPRPGLLGIRA